jgi:hypothetical protein
MIGGFPDGSPWHLMEIQVHKVIERALCDYFGLDHGSFVSSSTFKAPPGFVTPPWSMTIGIPAGTWLYEKYPWLTPEGRAALGTDAKGR